MAEHDAVGALIERVVAGARIASRAERDDLRRELRTHFEEAARPPESVAYAIRRFGNETAVTDSLCRVYRWDYFALYLAKIAASIIVSVAAALLILALVHLRLEVSTEVWRFAPGFSRAAGLSLAVVLGLVAVWEMVRRPFSRSRAAMAAGAYAGACGLVPGLIAHSTGTFVTATMLVALGYLCSTLASRPIRWLLTCAAFALAEYGVHVALRVAFAPGRAVLAGAILAAVWASTVFILTHADRAFLHLFEPVPR